MTGPTPLVSFVIPVRDDAVRLQRCLASIDAARGGRPIEVIVTDNGSVDDSEQVARAAGAKVIAMPGRRIGELRNRGAASAGADVLAFVDSDHEIDRDWITAALATLRDPGVAAAGARCSAPRSGGWVGRMYDGLRGRDVGQRDVNWLGSGNMAVRRAAFEAVGGFDPKLETCEDVDLCRRLRESGYRLLSDGRLRSVHHGDPANLPALFFGELWRGRDNLAVSLRSRPSLRDVPSIVMPVVTLCALLITAVAVVPEFSSVLARAGIAAFAAVATARAARILLGLDRPRAAEVPQALVVGATYELARGLALLVHVSHASRRGVARR